MAELDNQSLKLQAIRLLDKAGRDPRLTPRILREKCEDKLQLPRYALKPKRSMLKKLIIKWLIQNHELIAEIDKEIDKSAKTSAPVAAKPAGSSSSSHTEEQIIQQLAKFAKAKGLLPLVKAIAKSSEGSNSVKINEIRKKLREEGLTFSDIPTDKEILAAMEEAVVIKEEASEVAPQKRVPEEDANPQPHKAPRV